MNADEADPPDDPYETVLDRIETLAAAFAESRHFEGLSDHQQREATFVVESVGELLYNYEDATLETCTEEDLERVCTRVYPAKISAEPEHFAAVAPVVSAFLSFLADRGDHDRGAALADRIEDLDDEIIAAAADPDNWGMAKSMVMGDADPGGPPEDVVHLSDAADQSVDLAGAAGEGIRPTGDAALTEEERAVLEEATDQLSTESGTVIEEVMEVLDGAESPPDDPAAVFGEVDATPAQFRDALDELFTEIEAAGGEVFEGPGDDEDPSVLDTDAASRFLELYGRLLVYVNDRFDVVPAIDSYEDLETAYLDEIRPIRERLYHEDTETVVLEFVDENPADLSPAALEQVESWTAHEVGQFAATEHRETDTVFLDPEDPPRAYGVTGVHEPLSERLPDEHLPVQLTDVVLLPFEGRIVHDGYLNQDPIGAMVWEFMDVDLDAADEEARHRFGVAETLPPPEESGKTDAEKLRFYTRNKENRERYAEEIDRLRNKNEKLARIYHQQIGKGRARSLGREFRDLGLEAAYVAIYDGQVVASAPTETKLRETLSEIMPDGRADHPYVYHYDP